MEVVSNNHGTSKGVLNVLYWLVKATVCANIHLEMGEVKDGNSGG